MTRNPELLLIDSRASALQGIRGSDKLGIIRGTLILRNLKVHISDDGKKRLEELKNILLKKGLLDKDEEVIETMMEDLTHFAYFMGCITKRDVRRLLALTDHEAKAKIRYWKIWQEGNRSCGLSRNPFTEEWNLTRVKKTK